MNTSPSGSIQNGILMELRNRQVPIIIYLINGFRLGGKLKNFDTFTLILEENDTTYIIYKHAVSTIIPQKLIDSL